ncbi:SRPBCC family protein [Vineibacter terrae]|uniref:SRPBCC family protein n=1 Tax=Vineibacter terrae TaxID=2586908 RepID=UPI002E34885C|nr:SRPBCC family protein [Vineibacter terrae]HEX2887932.1 SRPBCC family protein [Vineibacter terrae]
MASLRQDIPINAPAEDAWAALRDFGALHQRLVPGFVVDCRLDGPDARIVTFFNGMQARELLVDIDDAHRRLAYAIVDGRATHYSASAQVLAEGAQRSRFVWIIDLLPDALAPSIAAMQAQGAKAIKQTLDRQPAQG